MTLRECPDGGDAIDCRDCREQMPFARELWQRFCYWLKYGEPPGVN